MPTPLAQPTFSVGQITFAKGKVYLPHGDKYTSQMESILLPYGKVDFPPCVRKGRRCSPIASLHTQPREATAPVHDDLAGAGRSLAPHLNQNCLSLSRKHSAHDSCRQPLLSPWDLIPAEDAPRRSRGTAKATTISARHQNHSKADGGRPAERAEGRDVPPGPIAAIPWASCQTARLEENPKTVALEVLKRGSKNPMVFERLRSPDAFR